MCFLNPLFFSCLTPFIVSPVDCKLQEGRTVFLYLGYLLTIPTQKVCVLMKY